MSESDSPASRNEWANLAAAWERTSKESETTSSAYDDVLIEGAGIRAGMRVLDLAAGMGDPTMAIARRVGTTGHVVALDQAPEMLAGARRRAAADGVDVISAVAADMAALPFADATFDAATCRYGLMFPPDRVAAAREAHRVLRPGARAAILVWGPYEENTTFAVVRRTVLAFLGEPGGDTPPLRHVFAEEGALSGTLAAAGFADVAERAITTSDLAAADGSAWRNRLERTYSNRLEKLDAAGRADLERALAEAFEPYREGEGYRISTHAKLGTGVVPGE